jgi:hypothetical protein
MWAYTDDRIGWQDLYSPPALLWAVTVATTVLAARTCRR